MISVCFLFFKIPLPRGGSYPSIVVPTGAKHRVQSPLERRPRTISTDRPEMESRPYEFLLQVMSSNHLILCHPLLLLPSIFPSIRVFSNESVLHQVAKVLMGRAMFSKSLIQFSVDGWGCVPSFCLT